MKSSKIFSKKLTETDIGKRCSVPTSSLGSFPSFEEDHNYQDIMVEDEGGNLWQFRLIVRSGMYAKPVLSKGWLYFVKKMGLRKGFKVKFFRDEGEVSGEVKYKVKVKKPYVVFKKEFGYISHFPAG